jgi:hypothetical protein
MCRSILASTFALSKGSVAVTDRGSSVEVAALLKARGWSFRVLLLAAAGVLASVIFNVWSTVSFMQNSAPDALNRVNVSQRATDFLLYGGTGPYLLPLAMLLIGGCLVLVHRPPQGAAGTLLWNTPTSRLAELQGEAVGLAVLAGVVALGYAGVALLGLPVSQPLTSVEIARGTCATILASSAATLCLLGVLLTYWWILGVPRRVTQED